MKKLFLFLMTTFIAFPSAAQNSLSDALPLLQQKTRTAAQTQQVFDIFRYAKDDATAFAAGASLTRLPPSKLYEPALLNVIIRDDNPLKTAFSAVILTAMGSPSPDFLPILEGALQSPDPVLRAYAGTAYTLIKPETKKYAQEVVLLYIYDAALAARAMNAMAGNEKQEVAFLKQGAESDNASTRAAAARWLGALMNKKATAQLLKMAKTETDSSVQTQLAMSLAGLREQTFGEVIKGLKKDYTSPVSATYALALGFMTGHAVDPLRVALGNQANVNIRINALRACAYMAGVLSNPDAFNYTSDRAFDASLLKTLIPQIKAFANARGPEAPYAQNALRQLEKLI
jgi:HEAT repeat protein